MVELLEKISPERQERLLNPQMSDHYKTFLFGKYGHRIYTVKVGRKWVMLRSNNHRARISLDKFIEKKLQEAGHDRIRPTKGP